LHALAESRQKEIVELDKKIYSPKASSTGLSWNKLGEIQFEMNKFADAEHSLKQAVEIREALSENFDTSVSRDNLARVYEALGRFQEARAMRMKGRPAQNIACGNFSVRDSIDSFAAG
jgi:uncharacterized protein HemY